MKHTLVLLSEFFIPNIFRKMETAVIITIMTAFIAYLIYDSYYTGNREWIKSSIDNRDYYVLSLENKQGAADLLAQIRANLRSIMTHLEKTVADDPRTQRIILNFNIDNIEEGRDDKKFTSYSVNKTKMIFCLRSRSTAERTLEDLNTLTFVALHELAHVGTSSIGHTDEFWANFRWILEHAINIGIYSQTDYKKKPKEYCGTTISSSPLPVS